MPYKDPEKQKQAQRESLKRNRDRVNAAVRRKRRELAAYIESKKQKPCLDCGQTFHACVMEFDHVRGEKQYQVGQMANMRLTREVIDEEIAKCDLVCANCHRLRTFERGQYTYYSDPA